MLKLIKDIPPSQIGGVALSGGVDSKALISFLNNHQQGNPTTAYFFHHGTTSSESAYQFLIDYCEAQNIPLEVGFLSADKHPRQSWEEFWRLERYAWLEELAAEQGVYIATAHHLNDLAETYVWGMAHGHPRYIHYIKPGGEGHIIRPLLLTPKKELYAWCDRHDVPYIEDTSNQDISFTRNRIRHKIIPEMLEINPGFLKTVAKSWKDFFAHG